MTVESESVMLTTWHLMSLLAVSSPRIHDVHEVLANLHNKNITLDCQHQILCKVPMMMEEYAKVYLPIQYIAIMDAAL